MKKDGSRLSSAPAMIAAFLVFVIILLTLIPVNAAEGSTGYNIPVDLNNLTPTSLEGSIIFSQGYGSLTKRGDIVETGPSSYFPITRFYKYQSFTIDADEYPWMINSLGFDITYSLPIDVDWSDAYIGFTFMSSMRFNQKVYATPADCYVVIGGTKFEFNSVQTDGNTNNYYTFLVKDAPYSGNSITIHVEYDWNGGYYGDLAEGFDFCFQSSEALISTELTLEGSFLQKIWQEIGGLSESIGSEIKDAFNEIEQKDQAASDKSQEDINNALDSYTGQSVINSLQGLIGAMGNENQQFVFTFPSIVIPEIPNVISEIKLNDPMTIDINEALSVVPPVLIDLIRNVFVAAVILYVVKDLYSLYLQILDSWKGGGSSGE